MGAIYKEVTIGWAGREWNVTPTYRMIQQIEQQVSIAGMAGRIANGDPPMSHISYVVAFLLRHAGCRDVSPDDVYASMMTEMTTEQVSDMAAIVISGFVPQRDNSGNAAAPQGAASHGGRPKKSKK